MPGTLKNILVVDDEVKIVEVVKSYLENSGYRVFKAYSGEEALETYSRINPSLIILDLMLPDIPGEEVCRTIRRDSTVPIIMLTARVEEENILEGLYTGADDYVTKPFSPRQLMARVAAVLRRSDDDTPAAPEALNFGGDDLVIDIDKHEVRKKGAVVSLTPNEFRLLETLAGNRGRAYTREELIKFAIGEDFDGYDRTIDTHIKNLRQKIETDSREPKYILTVHGIGYRFGGEQI